MMPKALLQDLVLTTSELVLSRMCCELCLNVVKAWTDKVDDNSLNSSQSSV